MQNWKELYKEISAMLRQNIQDVKWIDLWHNQVNFLTEEHPFPSPAVFLQFRTLNVADSGLKVQNLKIQIDAFLFYETFADTYDEYWNQDEALGFLDILSKIHATFHGTDGESYSSMRRIGFSPVDTGGAGNTYQISFECVLTDYSAMRDLTDVEIDEIGIIQGFTTPEADDDNIFVID